MPTFHNQESFDDVYVVRETGNALLCDINGEEMWIPKSQISDDSEIWEGEQEGTLVISAWIARQKGLIA